MRVDRFLLAVLSLVLAVTAAGPAPKKGARTTPPKNPLVWRVAPGYDVHHSARAGWVAQVYQAPDFRHLLVMPVDGETGWVVDLAQLKYFAIGAIELALEDNRVEMPNLAKKAFDGPVERKEAELRFSTDGGVITIEPGQALVGDVTMQHLLQRRPDYAAAAQAYAPDPAAIAVLKTRKSPVDIQIFFGTWCSHCRRYIPALIRTLELAQNPVIRTRFVAIDPDRTQPKDQLARWQVKLTPTIIVVSKGREVGRIVGDPSTTLERDLVNLIVKAP